MIPLWRKRLVPTFSGQPAVFKPGCPLFFRPRVDPLEDRLLLSTYTVTNTLDSGPGSLRQAILDSNSNGGPNVIDFSIDSGAQTITPASPLPAMTNPVTIDGTTQPGFTGSPLIVLTGTSAGSGASGLTISGGPSTVKGLVINGFSRIGVQLMSSGDLVEGNYLGTDVTGTIAHGNDIGVEVSLGYGNDTIGGTTAADRNVISGNTSEGIRFDPLTGANLIQGNYIGTDVTGANALGNGTGSTGTGVFLQLSVNNTIGGTTAGARNVISGNSGTGVFDQGSGGDVLEGNYIGTDASGTRPLSNGIGTVGDGVFLQSPSNRIGGTTPGAGNLISGNSGTGVYIQGSGNVLEGNYIGTDVTGTQPLGNGTGVQTADATTVGGVMPGAGNLISGNQTYGVFLSGAGDVVQGNFIGTDITGSAPVGNTAGIFISGIGSHSTIGGTTAAARNLISGNTQTGMSMVAVGHNRIEGNYIGTDVTGTNPLGNRIGIVIGESNDRIGGTNAGAGNLISGNVGFGIDLTSAASRNRIEGNYIGTDFTGTAALPNGFGIVDSGFHNKFGGRKAGAGNLISGNITEGIDFASNGGREKVQGNYIGTDVTGTRPLGNGDNGILIGGAAYHDSIGGTKAGAGNIIAFNGHDGIFVAGGTRDPIHQNSIFANAHLGIELILDGNHNQASPVITSAISADGQITIQGTLTSTATTQFTLEFFANPVADSSGAQFLGSDVVTTDGSGQASFTVSFSVGVPPNQYITGTATAPTKDTSEFSTPVIVMGGARVDVNRTVFFLDASGLWKSDGTAAGTVFLEHINEEEPAQFADANGTLFFQAASNGFPDRQPWDIDGTQDARVTGGPLDAVMESLLDPAADVLAWNWLARS
jgi:titin